MEKCIPVISDKRVKTAFKICLKYGSDAEIAKIVDEGYEFDDKVNYSGSSTYINADAMFSYIYDIGCPINNILKLTEHLLRHLFCTRISPLIILTLAQICFRTNSMDNFRHIVELNMRTSSNCILNLAIGNRKSLLDVILAGKYIYSDNTGEPSVDSGDPLLIPEKVRILIDAGAIYTGESKNSAEVNKYRNEKRAAIIGIYPFPEVLAKLIVDYIMI